MDLHQAVRRLSEGDLSTEKWMQCYDTMYLGLRFHHRTDGELLETFKTIVECIPASGALLQKMYDGHANLKRSIDAIHCMAYFEDNIKHLPASAALARYLNLLAWAKAFPSLDHSRIKEIRAIVVDMWIAKVNKDMTSKLLLETTDALHVLGVSTIHVADTPVTGSPDLGLPVEVMKLVLEKCESVKALAETSKEMRRLCGLFSPGSGAVCCKSGESVRVLIRVDE